MNPEQSKPERDAEVIPFPAAQVEWAPEVIEGELVTDAEYGRIQRLRQLPVQVVRVVRDSERTAQVKAITAYRVRKAPRDAVRLTWFALRGHGRWVGKGWTWVTHADLRADARAARVAGNAEARRAAQEAIRSDARARWAKVRGGLVAVGVGAGGVTVVAGVLALVNATIAREDMWGWLAAVFTVLDVLGAVLPWLVVAGLVGWLVAAAWEGRDRTPGAGFLIAPDRDDADSWIDERMISQALAHLGLTPLDRFLKGGGELIYTVPARLDGDGTYAQVRLPMGVPAEKVIARRNTLAGNLGRAPLETWPTQGDEAGILELWVADKGKLGNGAGEWPLLHEGVVDVFEGVPVGRSLRGAVINAPLFANNYLIGGRPGQGKTAFGRTLAAGAALDPTAELWVFVMGESPDFAPFQDQGRLSRYAMGMDDSVAKAAVDALEAAIAEMERRGKVLGKLGLPKTSRKLANRPELGLHWLGIWIDECHELFMHPRYGARAAELAIRLIKRGRKYGITLILMTQSPLKDSIPREVTRNVSCGVAFSVGDQVANDGLLGSGRYSAGIRATDLRMNVDRGTCVTVGLTDAAFELLNSYYIAFEEGRDEVTPVVRRAMAEIAGGVRRTGEPAVEAEPADELLDIAEVLSGERQMRTQVVLARLAELNRAHYEPWTFGDLATVLADYGVSAVKSHGVMVIRSADIAAAIAARNAEEEAGDGGR